MANRETPVDDLAIRQFRPGDEAALLALNAYGLSSVGISIADDYYASEDVANLEQTYGEEAGGSMLVGELNGSIVAMGGIRRLDATTCEILRMRVYPQYQGRGYGRMILEHLEGAARSLGYRHATLITGEDQHPAIDLYLNHGYRITEREVLIGIPSVHMIKDI
jgi:GNAT superfamily N-acetyltransferase